MRKVRFVRNMVALALLTCWPVMTSHALLQLWGVIHEVHADHDSGDGSHEHDAEDHPFADGGYVAGSSGIQVTKPLSHVVLIPFAGAALPVLRFSLEREVRPCGLSPPGTAPPELSQIWHFFYRAALPVRAPSLAS